MIETNLIQPFFLETSQIRGRMARLSDSLDQILKTHRYPHAVSALVAESCVLCALLSSMLKYDGVFTLQIKSDGPVSMLVADITSSGAIRAWASYDPSRIPQEKDVQQTLLGTGHMAFTVDQGVEQSRYQGIVDLVSSSLTTSVQRYFAQSEQIDVGLVVSVSEKECGWGGAGILVQKMPEDRSSALCNKGEEGEDDWRRAMILMSSVTPSELLDLSLSPTDLIFRLFHEDGVRVFEPSLLRNECRCDPERVKRIIESFTDAEIRDLVVDDMVTMVCEFCGRSYGIEPEFLKKKGH